MTDRIDPTRHALEDAELEVLLTGKIDDSPELRLNPVAAFLLDARQANYGPDPSPDERLTELFARQPGPVQQEPEQLDPVTAPIAVVGAGPRPTEKPPATELVISQPVTTGREPVIAAPVEVYKASTMRVVMEALTPSPSKILMALSAVLLLVIGAQALGAIQLLGGDGEGSDVVAGVEPANTITSTTTTVVASTQAPSVTPLIEEPLDATSTSATTVRPAPTEAPVTTEVEEPETTDTTVDSTEVTDGPDTTEEGTTIPETTTTEDSDTSLETSVPSTTVPSTVTITSIAPTSTTIGPGVVIIIPGRRYRAPDSLPTGFYSATVGQESGCSVEITYAEGNTENFQAPAGGTIVFRLFDGSEVVTGVGCPQIYRPSPG